MLADAAYYGDIEVLRHAKSIGIKFRRDVVDYVFACSNSNECIEFILEYPDSQMGMHATESLIDQRKFNFLRYLKSKNLIGEGGMTMYNQSIEKIEKN